jgi:prepilin-type N-terminal cleavage/methylation domain-containing protein
MLTRIYRLRTRAGDERGFTLIEVLVAMVTGIVVTGALFSILDFSVKQTGRLSQISQVAQTSGTAMTHIVDELHSACLSPGYAPVKAGSTSSKLIFVNAYFPETNEKAEAEYKFVRKDELEYTAAGKLTDTLSRPTGEEKEGEFPWKVSGTTTFAEGVSLFGGGSSTEPVFKYYEYLKEPSSGGSTEGASTLTEISPATLTAAQAAKVASVTVSFRTSPTKKEGALSKSAESGIPVDLKTQTTFAFSAPNSESTISAGPCE